MTRREDLEEALANYLVTVVRRMRGEGSLAHGIQVFLTTNRFREDLPQYRNSRTLGFDQSTDDLIHLVTTAKRLLGMIYRHGFAYKKVGVLLLDLTSRRERQMTFFKESPKAAKRKSLLEAMERYGLLTGTPAALD